MSRSRLKSKDFRDYFPAEFEDLRIWSTIPFGVCLYFRLNNHIILWRFQQEEITPEFKAHYRALGIHKIWVHRDEAELYENYMNQMMNLPPEKDAGTAPMEVLPPFAKTTPEGDLLDRSIDNPYLKDEEKIAIAQETATNVVNDLLTPTNVQEQRDKNERAKQIVHDLLSRKPHPSKDLLNQVWNLSNLDLSLEHATTVATYSVLFALSFGKVDRQVLVDLAIAGLLHDIGMVKVPLNTARIPFTTLSDDSIKEYEKHLAATDELIQKHAHHVTASARNILMQHHERFSGKGFPAKLKGFHFSEVAQVLSLADIVDTLSNGGWDGEERSLKESFEHLEHLEKSATFPDFFSPDVFSTVTRWTKSSKAQDEIGNAGELVKDQIKNIVDGDK